MRRTVLWILLGLLMIGSAAVPPVNRTQEARVLETAREMIGQPIRDWLVPRLNGELRLRKPPLAYWASAASMSVLGQNEFAGRLPTALLSWLSIGATYTIARRWFSRRVAMLSAGALAGSWLFFKHGLLAETDAYAAALMTIGVYSIVRADEAPRGRDIKWLYAVGVCLAGIVLAKGPPAMFLMIYWIARSGVRRDWRSLCRFVTRGGGIMLLVLAVPWFIYIARTTTAEGQLGSDLANSADGGDHSGPPWAYVPLLIKATLPWTGVWAAALAIAGLAMSRTFRQRRAAFWQSPLLDVALWAIAILLPLCVWGNKQFHYLLPVMPPTAMLIGWALALATRVRRFAEVVAVAGIITAFALALAGPAVLIAAWRLRGSIVGADVLMATALMAIAVVTFVAWRSRGRYHAAIALAGMAVLTMVAVHAWLPAVLGGRSRLAAIQLLEEFPAGHFAFRNTQLPVVSWSMRRAVPTVDDAAIAASGDASLVVLDQQTDVEAASVPPAGFIEAQRIRQGDNTLHVYVPQGRKKG